MLDRRHLLKLSVSAPLAWVLYRSDEARSQATASDVIDVHCHVFNASDVPVRGFVQRVVLGDEEGQIIIEPNPALRDAVIPAFLAFLVKLMSTGAPTAEQELEDIKTSSVREPPVSFERQVAEALEYVLSGAAPGVSEEGRRRLRESIIQEIGASEDADYESMAQGLSSGKGPKRSYVRFARKLKGYRRTLLAEAIDHYGGQNGVLLFTPSFVDFHGWLDSEQVSDLKSQIVLMERMQRLDWGETHMHSFVAFNPWRQIEDIDAGRSPSAFDLAKDAVENMGFVGIKLYPPMGFLPIGNKGSHLCYPERATRICNFLTKLDAALDTMYAWAEEKGVAVMAHATNSQGAAKDYALRARPDRWAPVLAKYPNLRLNLGHFGGFDEVADDQKLDETWEYFFGRLIKSGSYHCVFADMSYLNEVLPGHARRASTLRYLRDFLRQYDPDCDRLMYGSDFAMLVLEARYQDYLASFRSYISGLELSESARSRLYRDNAVKFLGLNKNAPTRNRLEAYYKDHKLDPAWLTRFDRDSH